ncbi:hypothetical protein B0H16DRAFT_265063 [Mycena metata]|uniref:Uncharacterized protein n=1 Tax=Mycena metata TaxID=1033252 RepID=A0AAD7HSN6_9AGAR|nr:hypothetical protein B0H16DRAFT_265063 [Mycena metata]
MPASPPHHPWPARTPEPQPPPAERHVAARQTVADQSAVAAAKTQCEIDSGNEVISCFPTADVIIPQHQWATFVWNSNNPDFLQTNRVDIYLFHGDSLEQIFLIANHVNPTGQAGSVTAQVNDTWWGTRGANWAGSNISYPFYWLIARAGEPLSDGTEKPQTTFSAVQTTFADSILSSMASSSASAASVSSNLAQMTSSSVSSSRTITTVISGSTVVETLSPNGSVQNAAANNNSSFPHWAIVLIVLGIVLVAALCGLMFFAIWYLRNREAALRREQAIPSRSRSSSPVMVEPDDAVPVAVGEVALARDTSATSGARTMSPAQRTTSDDSKRDSGRAPAAFSGSDAAIMADAFRAELRKAGRPFDEDDGVGSGLGGVGEENETPTPVRARSHERTAADAEREMLLRRDLGNEPGADIRSVGSARSVRVESSEGHGRTSPRRDFSL